MWLMYRLRPSTQLKPQPPSQFKLILRRKFNFFERCFRRSNTPIISNTTARSSFDPTQQRTSLSEIAPTTQLQPNCTLLSSLPLEIREQIWKEYLTGQKFYLESFKSDNSQLIYIKSIRRLSREPVCMSVWSRSGEPEDPHQGCENKYSLSNKPYKTSTAKHSILPLLQSCRQMYVVLSPPSVKN